MEQQLYKPFKRLFKGPLDIDCVFDSITEAIVYAKSNTAYDGQVLSIKTDNDYELFIVVNGTLHRVPFSINAKNTDNTLDISIGKENNNQVLSINTKISNDINNKLIKKPDGLYSFGISKIIKEFTIPESGQIEVHHDLNTKDICVSVWSTQMHPELCICDVSIINENTILVEVPTEDIVLDETYKIIIIG